MRSSLKVSLAGAGSVAVIVRSERVAGEVLLGRYDVKIGKYFQGEGPTNVPFEVA